MVIPLLEFTKYPRSNWAEMTSAEAEELMNERTDATGWVLHPRALDPEPLLILDIDSYGVKPEEAYQALYGVEIPPKGTGVVKSCSGGLHIYHRLPADAPTGKLNASFDLGSGIKGEIRASGANHNALIVLPGSVAQNKQVGARGKYEVIDFPTEVEELAVVPNATLKLFLDRPTSAGAESEEKEAPLPGPWHKTIKNIEKTIADGGVPNGFRGMYTYNLGELLGAACLRDMPTTPQLLKLWEAVESKFDGDFEYRDFESHFQNGYSKGHKTLDQKLKPVDKRKPLFSETLQEATNLFGHEPWLVIFEDEKGKPTEYQLGFGKGMQKTPEKAERRIRLHSLSNWHDVFAAMVRASGTELDSASMSQLSTFSPWGSTLLSGLKAKAHYDRGGAALEDQVKGELSRLALDAAKASKFGVGLTGWPKDSRNRREPRAYWWGIDDQTKVPEKLLLTEGMVLGYGRQNGIDFMQEMKNQAKTFEFVKSESKLQRERRIARGIKETPKGTMYTVDPGMLDDGTLATVQQIWRDMRMKVDD